MARGRFRRPKKYQWVRTQGWDNAATAATQHVHQLVVDTDFIGDAGWTHSYATLKRIVGYLSYSPTAAIYSQIAVGIYRIDENESNPALQTESVMNDEDILWTCYDHWNANVANAGQLGRMHKIDIKCQRKLDADGRINLQFYSMQASATFDYIFQLSCLLEMGSK